MPRTVPPMPSRLHAVKALHTLIWAFFAGCIIAIPLLAWAGRTAMALLFIGIVSIEVLILAANHWHCPLTAVAARYADNQPDNFDIYLPLWLARYNKEIFGSLYLGGVVVTALRWLGWLG